MARSNIRQILSGLIFSIVVSGPIHSVASPMPFSRKQALFGASRGGFTLIFFSILSSFPIDVGLPEALRAFRPAPLNHFHFRREYADTSISADLSFHLNPP